MAKMVQGFKRVVDCVTGNNKSNSLIGNEYLEPVVSQTQKQQQQQQQQTFVEVNGNKLNISVKGQEKKKLRFFKTKSKKDKIVVKQPSQDSNYFSDPEAPHYYEEIDEKYDFSEDDLLIQIDKDNGSKNNLYCEVSHSEKGCSKVVSNTLTREDSKDLTTKKTFLESRYNRLREYISLNKENTNSHHTYHVIAKNEAFEKDRDRRIKNEEKSCLLDNDLTYAVFDDEVFNNTTVLYDDLEEDEEDLEYKSKTIDKKFRFEYNKLNEVTRKRVAEPTAPPPYSSIFNRLTLKRKAANVVTTQRELQQQEQQQQQQDGAKKKKQFTCLTEIKPTSLFASQSDGIVWYFNLLCDTMLFNIKDCKHLTSQESKKAVNLINAHLLYVKNLYEVRIALSKQLKQVISNIHPCIVALALLLDSDAIRICESHACVCDNYVYLFSTKIKFCSWKAKYYIILKKPKQSSLDRLNLIEDIINCHKLIQDKSIL